MAWNNLGFVVPTDQWQFCDVAAIDSETFRVRQSYSKKPWGPAFIGQAFIDPGGYSNVRRIYPHLDETILTLPIPKEFREQGLVVRYIALKLSPYTRLWSLNDWRFDVDVFYP